MLHVNAGFRLNAPFKACLLLAFGALINACKVGPDYHAPTPPAGADAPLISLNTLCRKHRAAAR